MAGRDFARSTSAVRRSTKSATGKLILTIFAGFAQFEREMMLGRQREGIAKAKAENRYLEPDLKLVDRPRGAIFRSLQRLLEIRDAVERGRSGKV